MLVTQDKVDAACADIIAKNEKLIHRNVRNITGGSYSTVGPMIEDWKARQQEADDLAAIQVPEAISTRMTEAAAAIWKAATEAATEGHHAMREAILEAKDETDAAKAEMSEIIADLEEPIESLQAERDDALTEAKQNSVQIVRVEEQLKGVLAETARADTARQDADKRAIAADARAAASEKRFDELMKKMNNNEK